MATALIANTFLARHLYVLQVKHQVLYHLQSNLYHCNAATANCCEDYFGRETRLVIFCGLNCGALKWHKYLARQWNVSISSELS